MECASSATSDSRQVAGRRGPVVRPKSWEAIPFVSFGGLHTVLPGGRGATLYGTKLATAAPSFACRRRLEIRGWGVQGLSRPAPGPPPGVAQHSGQKMPSKNEGVNEVRAIGAGLPAKYKSSGRRTSERCNVCTNSTA